MSVYPHRRGIGVSSVFVFGPPSDNVLDTTKITNGYLVGSGTITVDPQYFTSDYIPVNNGDVVRYLLDVGMGGNNSLYLFDSDKNFVTSITGTTTSPYRTATVNKTNAKYARLSFSMYKQPEAMITVNKPYPSKFEQYKADKFLNDAYGLNNTQRIEIRKGFSANPLTGKIVSFNGDSISSGAGSSGGYGKIIADRNGMIYENISVGGATIASGTMNGGANRHWVSQTIGNMRADADYIILEGGVNDKSLTTPVTLGTMTNSMTDTYDHTTFIGAMEYMFSQAVARFPGKKIGFVLVHRLWALNDVFETQWYPAIVSVCKKWGIPLCDLYKSVPSLNLIPALKADYTKDGDGWHPNEPGYKMYYCDKIEAWMRSL